MVAKSQATDYPPLGRSWAAHITRSGLGCLNKRPINMLGSKGYLYLIQMLLHAITNLPPSFPEKARATFGIPTALSAGV